MFIIHFSIIIKSEVLTFSTVVIFFRGFVPEVVVLSSYAVAFIFIAENPGLVSCITMQSYDVRK